MSTASNEQLGVVIAWLEAMRRGELDAAVRRFRPEASWQGVPEDGLCRNREEVLAMLEEVLAHAQPRAAALELIAGDGAVVLGVRSDDLQAVGDTPLPGQLYSVFEIRDGQIASVRDFARRADALAAAGARAPDWS